MTRSSIFLLIPVLAFISGCAGTMYEVITSDPYGAYIYWGKTQSDLERTGYKTPYSRSVSKSSWASWCYQIRKDGYHDSKAICRQKEEYRHMDFRLIPLRTIITSEPEGAIIYWGPNENKLKETIHATPRTEKNVSLGANWKDWYYQVKKKGYYDSEVMFKSQDSRDRYVHFKLKPHLGPERKSNVSPEPKRPMSQNTVSGSQVTLSWQDSSSNELGFKIERKTGSEGTYHEIAKVGPNVTTYTDTGLSKATTYFYRVRAYNSDGHSAYSEEIVVKTSAD